MMRETAGGVFENMKAEPQEVISVRHQDTDLDIAGWGDTVVLMIRRWHRSWWRKELTGKTDTVLYLSDEEALKLAGELLDACKNSSSVRLQEAKQVLQDLEDVIRKRFGPQAVRT